MTTRDPLVRAIVIAASLSLQRGPPVRKPWPSAPVTLDCSGGTVVTAGVGGGWVISVVGAVWSSPTSVGCTTDGGPGGGSATVPVSSPRLSITHTAAPTAATTISA